MKTIELNATSSDFRALIAELNHDGEIVIVDHGQPIANWYPASQLSEQP